jgi:hypothetical protein
MNYCGGSQAADSSIMIKDCLICFTEKADGVLMNCGHAGICYSCGVKMI